MHEALEGEIVDIRRITIRYVDPSGVIADDVDHVDAYTPEGRRLLLLKGGDTWTSKSGETFPVISTEVSWDYQSEAAQAAIEILIINVRCTECAASMFIMGVQRHDDGETDMWSALLECLNCSHD